MIDDIIKQINNENLKEVVAEYKATTELMLSQNNAVKHTSENSAFLFFSAINNVMIEKSKEQIHHLEKTANLAYLFANELNLSQKDKKNLILLARYHDIGKINISKDILNKPSKLNDEEWEIIKQHPIYSYNILKAFPDFQKIALGALYHHERFDGTGYPSRLAGTSIPFLARIISILDTYEVLTGGRVYKAAVSSKDALKELRRCSGTQFDPILVNAFINFIYKQNLNEVVNEQN